jgi:hypothetical protein
MYFDGVNYIGVEEADALQSPLPAAITAGRSVISSITTTPFVIPASYFGMHIGGYTPGATYPISFGTWRFLDAGVHWKSLETSRGVYDSTAVTKLNNMLSYCATNGIGVIYPVPYTPAWASSNPSSSGDQNGTGTAWCPALFTDLTAHVNYVLGRMAAYGITSAVVESWNEPNGPNVYKDTIGNLVTHCQTIKDAVAAWNTANSTTHRVMSPSFNDGGGVSTGSLSLDGWLAAGGGPACDIIGYHIYTGGFPAGLYVNLSIVDAVKAVMVARGVSAKEFWISECGDSYIANYANASANYIAQILLFCAAKGVKNYCWYSYDAPGILDMRISRVPALWEAARTLLSGKTVSWVNQLPGRKLAANIGGLTQFV